MEGICRGTDVSNESIAEPLDRKGTGDVTRLLYGAVDEEGGIGSGRRKGLPAVVKLPCYAPGETWWCRYPGSMQKQNPDRYSCPCATG
jgi:hypothetical protein